MNGRNLLLHGMIRRIGDGTKVNVYHDNWNPRTHSLVPLGAEYVPNITKVANLLNARTQSSSGIS